MNAPYNQQQQPYQQQPCQQPQYPQQYPPQYAPQYQQGPPPPDNYLVWAVLTTCFCCLPLGIVAIVKATSVNTLWQQGHYDAARAAALSAKNWSFWSALSTFFLYAGIFLIAFLGTLPIH